MWLLNFPFEVGYFMFAWKFHIYPPNVLLPNVLKTLGMGQWA